MKISYCTNIDEMWKIPVPLFFECDREFRHAVYEATVEKTEMGWRVFFKDVPGCVAHSDTEDGLQQIAMDALERHLDHLVADTR